MQILNDNDFLFNEILNPLFFGLWSIIEMYRLYLGYVGNLREQVSYLAAFWFISIFPQLLLQFYFLSVQKPLLPIDEVHAYITIAFLLIELVLGYRATSRIIRNKTARFAVEYGNTDLGEKEQEEEEKEQLLRRRGAGPGRTNNNRQDNSIELATTTFRSGTARSTRSRHTKTE